MINRIRLLAIIFVTSFTVFSFGQSEKIWLTDTIFEYRTNALQLVIQKSQNGQLILKKIATPETEGLIHLDDTQHNKKPLTFWIIDLLEPSQKIYSSGAKFINWDLRQSFFTDTIKLLWNYKRDELDLAISVSIEIPKYSSVTLWRMSIYSKNGVFTPQRIVFPVIGEITPSGEKGNIRLISPRLWGEEYFVAENQEITSAYPSAALQMQFWALYNDKSNDGLYISARDTLGYYKLFKNTVPKAPDKNMWIEPWYFPEPIPTVVWSTPYPIEIRPYQGDWYEAAKFYRNWIASTNIVIPNKQKSHKWIMENDFWLRTGPKNDPKYTFINFKEELAAIERVHQDLGVNTAIHLYNWHKHGFDDMYPDYFPPRAGFEQFLRDMHQSGIQVVPYINGRIVDERMVQKNIGLQNSITLADISNLAKSNTETWRGKTFRVMCPSAKEWQNTLFEINQRLLSKYKTDGVYLDQVCNSKALRCVNALHGHIPDRHNIGSNSSGTHWVKGYQSIFDKIKKELNEDDQAVFISEDAAEAWNNFFDIFLMYNSRSTDFKNSYQRIPLYPTVFSGYTLTMGFQDLSVEADKYLETHTSFLGRAFVWGAQLGWLEPKKLLSSKILFDYAKKLARVRQKIHHYLHFGEMKRTPHIQTNISAKRIDEWVVVKGQRNYFQYTLSPIQASFWELSEDSALVLITSFTSKKYENENISIKVDLSDSQLKPGLYVIKNEDINESVESKDETLEISVQLGAYDVHYFEIIRN